MKMPDVLNPFAGTRSDSTEEVKIDLTKTFAFHHKSGGKNFAEVYKLGPKSDAFLHTYQCTHRATKQERSVKILSLDRIDRKALLRELDIMKRADWPNLAKFYECFEDDQRMFVVTESMAHDNLFDAVAARRANKEAFGEAHVALIMLALLETLNYCHQHQIIHGDVNPKNILIPKGKGFGKLLLVEYQATHYKRTPASEDDSTELTKKKKSAFRAPEATNGPAVARSDVWSVGVLAHQLLTGKLPFKNSAAMKKPLDSEAFLSIKDPKARSFVQDLLTYSVQKRPRAVEAYDHQWLLKGKSVEDALDTELQTDVMNHLAHSSKRNKLQQAVSAYIATNLLQKVDLEKLGQIFRECDRNMDGALSRSEMKQCFEKAGIKVTPTEMEAIFLRLDIDGSGQIEYSEFLANQSDVLRETSKLKAAFDAFDLDMNGYISHEELKEIFNLGNDSSSMISSSTAKALIAKADGDNDGTIDFDEFVKMMSA